MGLMQVFVKEFLEKKMGMLAWVSDEKPVQGYKVTIDLTNAKTENDPLVVSYAFRSIFMQSASDPTVSIFLKPVSKSLEHSAFKMNLRDSFAIDYQVPQCFIHWDAQPGKSVELMFFADGEFRSGSQLSLTAGGVSVNEGSSVSGVLNVTMVASTPIIIAPQNLNRKLALLENKTGADIYLSGDSNVSNTGANEGVIWSAGQAFEYRNTAALYGFSTVGGKVTRLEQG